LIVYFRQIIPSIPGSDYLPAFAGFSSGVSPRDTICTLSDYISEPLQHFPETKDLLTVESALSIFPEYIVPVYLKDAMQNIMYVVACIYSKKLKN
jgi:hypothetical protein